MSPDEIIRRATRLITSGQELMPEELLDVARQIIGPCQQCAQHPEQEYEETVAEIAREVARRVREGEISTRDQLLDEIVNDVAAAVGDQNHCMEILRYSDNQDYALVHFGNIPVSGDGINWHYLAHWALYGDVLDHPDAPDWNTPFQCPHCASWYEDYDDAQNCCTFVCDCDEEFPNEEALSAHQETCEDCN